MRKRILIILVIVALAIAGVVWSARLGRQDPNIIKLSGNIELTQVDISFKIPGKLVERTLTSCSRVRECPA